ncbi:UdgX family uracil-DNA binding protein [Komagataeibacter sucrofermentans]|uniref:Type-4 uracil-DNA glycosylase n=1 Tax=Komagataeibacter sucrofermentans TaxID=1053551 RepID=A0A318QN52_9PROT|nr:UdgX family uracil-DNA binding protein [Komagataeibacter sucrofermentans]PYD78948.1 uracil-DNA glycosylase [Komagataeibacter sucrofermentans]GBQ46289.1 phage DNA polymerase-like protein [Komagataeibacter sucrofermentans DSM 15973]
MPHATVTLAHEADFAGWRSATRSLAGRHTPPADITWRIAIDTESAALPAPDPAAARFTVPRAIMDLAAIMVQSALPDRFALAYTLVYDHVMGVPTGEDAADRMAGTKEDVITQTRQLRDEIRRALPSHDGTTPYQGRVDTLDLVPESNARFLTLQRSFAPWQLDMPDRTLRWTGQEMLCETPGQAPQPLDPTSLPPPALPMVPDLDIARITSLRAVALAAKTCLICPMAAHATQTVFGEGREAARMMFVGEQPGDIEDRAGRPFVGPAGQLFDRALLEAGIGRDDTYVTNTVKHFKFRRTPTRRIHEKAGPAEIAACAPWLAAERRIIRPAVVVMLGVTAASALLGRAVTISRERSRIIPMGDGSDGLVTVHPSYLLRLPDEAARTREYDRFVNDLRLAAGRLAPAVT